MKTICNTHQPSSRCRFLPGFRRHSKKISLISSIKAIYLYVQLETDTVGEESSSAPAADFGGHGHRANPATVTKAMFESVLRVSYQIDMK